MTAATHSRRPAGTTRGRLELVACWASWLQPSQRRTAGTTRWLLLQNQTPPGGFHLRSCASAGPLKEAAPPPDVKGCRNEDRNSGPLSNQKSSVCTKPAAQNKHCWLFILKADYRSFSLLYLTPVMLQVHVFVMVPLKLLTEVLKCAKQDISRKLTRLTPIANWLTSLAQLAIDPG